MKILFNLARKNKGFALMLVMIFTGLALLLLTGSMNYTSNTCLLNERNNQYNSSMLAAEAATEKVVSSMITDFKTYGQPGIAANLNSYKQMVPSSTESTNWSSFQFTDAQGNSARTYVAANGSSYFVADLGSTYSGLGGTRIPYKIISNARMTNGRFPVTNAVQQEIAFTTIPIFQYAIFYNSLLEFTRAATMTIRGRVHSNGSMYVGSLTNSSLTFYEGVTTVGAVEKRDWWDSTVADFVGTVSFVAGKTTNAPTMSLPIGTNNTSEAVHKVIERPPSDELPTSAMGAERYYNKAEVLILVSNNVVSVSVKNPFATSSNSVPTNQNVAYFVNTTNTMTDQREGRVQLLTEIDIGKFNTWMATNATVSTVLGAGRTPSIVYVEDVRGGYSTYTTNVTVTTNVTDTTYPGSGFGTVTTNLSSWTPNNSGVTSNNIPGNAVATQVYSSKSKTYQYKTVSSYTYNSNYTYSTTITTDLGNGAVRLVNGRSLGTNGLTLATPNGLYVKGHYNVPLDADLGTTNTANIKPASLIADGLTLLSSSWNDTNSTAAYTSRDATSTTVNAAIVSGNVISQGTTGTDPMSGGAHNLPRLLEDWSSQTLTINGSLVCLYQSTKANGRFIHPGYTGQYYVPPTRNWSFDRNFLDPNKLPPGTPAVRVLERLKWSNPPANSTTYAGY